MCTNIQLLGNTALMELPKVAFLSHQVATLPARPTSDVFFDNV